MKTNFEMDNIEMRFLKYINETKELISFRDAQIIKGFIIKAFEECSFNDFYSSGNENILKYAGVINGLKKNEYDFSMVLTEEYTSKLKIINEITKSLIENNENHLKTYNEYYRAAKYCVVVCSDETYKYGAIYNKKGVESICSTLKSIREDVSKDSSDSNTLIKNQKIATLLEKMERELFVNKKMLENAKNLKRNAYYSIKKVEIFLENREGKDGHERKNVFSNLVQKELDKIQNLHENENLFKKHQYEVGMQIVGN